MSEILMQSIGILGAACSIVSYQFKDNRKYFVLQALCGLCFGVHYWLLGAYTGSILDFICLIRGFGYAVERNRKPYFTLILSCSLILAATALTYGGYLSLLPCAALLTSSVGMFTGRPTGMRILQFTVVSPSWLIYNICTFSIGGILCEAFNMLSILVYFIRTKLLKKDISA